MADNGVIDTLTIKINAEADDAIDNLSELENRLKSLSTVVSNISGTSTNLSSLAGSLREVNNVNLNNLSRGITQLRRIGSVRFNTNVSDLSNITQQFTDLSRAMVRMGSINYRDTHIRPFINSINLLSGLRIDPDLISGMNDFANSIQQFSTIQDVSSNLIRFISALGRLASTGTAIRAVTIELPNFAQAIRRAATVLSRLGGVNPQITHFITALGQLANAGRRMPEAAQNLRIITTALEDMIQAIGGMNINQDVSQLVGAIAQLATSLGSINGSGGNGGGLRTSTQRVSSLTKAFQTLGSVGKKALKNLISLLQKVGTSVGSAFGNLVKQIAGVKEASTHMFTLSDGIKSVIGGLIGMRGITGVFNWAKEAISAGGDITEIDHIVKSVFGKDMVGYVDEWANNAIEKFGIAAGAAKQYAGVLSSMFQASNITAHESGEMAMRMVELAGDLSAFYNIDTEAAYTKIKSGLAGMVRPLRKQNCAYVQRCA